MLVEVVRVGNGVGTVVNESGGRSESGRRKKDRVHLMEGHANKIGTGSI